MIRRKFIRQLTKFAYFLRTDEEEKIGCSDKSCFKI